MSQPRPETRSNSAAEKIFVALDMATPDEALRIVEELSDLNVGFKIGLQLFSVAGSKFVREMVDRGLRIFLDLKFHDIPTTVSRAGVEAARMGVSMFNVHASGGSEMMATTLNDVGEFCDKTNLRTPRIIAVTVLTSSDASTLLEIGAGEVVSDQVVRLALLTAKAGLHGVVASPNEIGEIRSAVSNPGFILVTPGIRPISATNDDQKRVMTPGEAISRGSDYLVIGRPIVGAIDPRRETANILDEIKNLQD